MKDEVKPVPERDTTQAFDSLETTLAETRLWLSILPTTLTLTLLALFPDAFLSQEVAA